MMERPPNIVDSGNEKIKHREEFLALAKELSENKEGFPFHGVNPESYLKIKATDDAFPGYATPIDQLIEKFSHEGMKVVLSETPSNREVYILPAQSNNIGEDSISPKDIEVGVVQSDELKKLISLSRSLKNSV